LSIATCLGRLRITFSIAPHRLTAPLITGSGIVSAIVTAPDNAINFGLSLAVIASGALLAFADVYGESRHCDARILAHLATDPSAHVPQIGRALGLTDRAVGRSLAHLVKKGLVVPETESEPLAMLSYRLPA
jgi:hypothetical protein